MLKKCRIQIEDFGEIATEPGRLFLDILNRHGVDLHNDCGGNGKCGKCRIDFQTEAPPCLKGDLFHLSEEEIAQGIRLACFHQIRDDCAISVPPIQVPDLLDNL